MRRGAGTARSLAPRSRPNALTCRDLRISASTDREDSQRLAGSATARLSSSSRRTCCSTASRLDESEADGSQSRQRNGVRFFAVIESITGEPLLRSMDAAVHCNTSTPSLSCLRLTTTR